MKYLAKDFKRLCHYDKFDEFSQISKMLIQFRGDDNIKFLIAGGSIRRIICGHDLKAGDIDLFFSSEEDALEFYKNIKNNVKLISDQDHAISAWFRGYKIQIIKKFNYKNDLPVEQFLDGFDFTLCQCAYDYTTHEFIFSEYSLVDIAKKRLVPHKITFPLASMRRVIKYTNQGFYMCNGSMQEYLNQVRALSDKDFKERQILYVD